MGFLGVLSIMAIFSLAWIALLKRPRVPVLVLIGIPVFQVVGLFAALAFIRARPFDTDTITYFYDVPGLLSDSVKPGTSFIVHATSFVTRLTGGSFDDLMALYAIAGAASSYLMLRYCAYFKDALAIPFLTCLVLLLPTFHFYTSAIGKDGLSALALTLIVMGAFDFPSRPKTLAAGFILLLAVRPHIAAFAGLALLLSQMIGSKNRSARLAVIPLLLVSPIIGYFVFDAFLNVNIFDMEAVSNLLAERDQALVTSDYTINAIENPVLRVFGFLFYPLFFNADSALALFASVENLFLLLVAARIVYLIARYKLAKDHNVRFLILLFVMLALFIGLTNYNTGLGLRMKSMLIPVIAALLTSAEILSGGAKAFMKSRGSGADFGPATALAGQGGGSA